MTITVKNNSDGTYTVKCGRESVVIGTPRTATSGVGDPWGSIDFPPLSSSDGGVVAHIIDMETSPARGKVLDLEGMLADMKTTAASHSRTRGVRKTQSAVLEYTLKGQHSLDIGKIQSALGAPVSGLGLKARIFVGGGDE